MKGILKIRVFPENNHLGYNNTYNTTLDVNHSREAEKFQIMRSESLREYNLFENHHVTSLSIRTDEKTNYYCDIMMVTETIAEIRMQNGMEPVRGTIVTTVAFDMTNFSARDVCVQSRILENHSKKYRLIIRYGDEAFQDNNCGVCEITCDAIVDAFENSVKRMQSDHAAVLKKYIQRPAYIQYELERKVDFLMGWKQTQKRLNEYVHELDRQDSTIIDLKKQNSFLSRQNEIEQQQIAEMQKQIAFLENQVQLEKEKGHNLVLKERERGKFLVQQAWKKAWKKFSDRSKKELAKNKSVEG